MQKGNSKPNLINKVVSREQINYDGSQIASHWAYRHFGVEGDSIVVFKGSCNIPHENIVDLEDKIRDAKITSPMMLHFIIEHFHKGTFVAVLFQRLLAAIVSCVIEEIGGIRLKRDGDDLYHEGKKLTISVASASVHSAKIHFGINVVTPTGIDVPVTSLSELGIKEGDIINPIADAYIGEYEGSLRASTKVTNIG